MTFLIAECVYYKRSDVCNNRIIGEKVKLEIK